MAELAQLDEAEDEADQNGGGLNGLKDLHHQSEVLP